MSLFFLLTILLGALVILALIAAVYYLLYKKQINRMLKKGVSAVHPMAPPYKVLIFAAIVLLLLATVISYLVGYKTAYDRIENAAVPQPQYEQMESFYGEITSIKGSLETGNSVTVQGLEVNDSSFHGEFVFAFFGETALTWKGESLRFSDLEVGDRVCITFTGEVTAGTPAVIAHVIQVQLLDDEK